MAINFDEDEVSASAHYPLIADIFQGLTHKQIDISNDENEEPVNLSRNINEYACHIDHSRRLFQDTKQGSVALKFQPAREQLETVSTFLSRRHIADQLYLVHYVTQDNTTQGISLKYDCPAQNIRRINRINAISSTGDIRIRRLLLIPLSQCGAKLRNKRFHQAPHPEKTILDDYEDDVENFLEETFHDKSQSSPYTNISNCKHFATLPGSTISREIWRDIGLEFKDLNQSLQKYSNKYLSGFIIFDEESDEHGLALDPTFIIRIPTSAWNTSPARELPTPKTSIEMAGEDQARYHKVPQQSEVLPRARTMHTYQEMKPSTAVFDDLRSYLLKWCGLRKDKGAENLDTVELALLTRQNNNAFQV